MKHLHDTMSLKASSMFEPSSALVSKNPMLLFFADYYPCSSWIVEKNTFQWSVLLEVGLVADHEADDVLVTEVFELLDPFLQVLEGCWSGDVIHQKGSVCAPVVCAGHWSVPFLSRGVPDLHFDGFLVYDHGFGGEFDSDSGFGL